MLTLFSAVRGLVWLQINIGLALTLLNHIVL